MVADAGEIAELDRRWQAFEAQDSVAANDDVMRRLESWGTPAFRSWRSAVRDFPSLPGQATHSAVILRGRALARRLEGSPHALVAHPSRLAEEASASG